MRESTELKETILREAEELFVAHGYAGTSIKQIAGASGCTTAALYYYFPEGKSQILREVVRCSFTQEFTAIIEAGRDATSLSEWVRALGHAAIQSLHEIHRRQNWIDLEMHQLGTDEQAVIHQRILEFHQAIVVEIARFVADESMANRLAWILVCALGGYGLMFRGRGLEHVSDFDSSAFVETMASLFGTSGY
jgi:AcrR family transcriptional regulator